MNSPFANRGIFGPPERSGEERRIDLQRGEFQPGSHLAQPAGGGADREPADQRDPAAVTAVKRWQCRRERISHTSKPLFL